MPGTKRYSATFDRLYEEEDTRSPSSPRTRSQSVCNGPPSFPSHGRSASIDRMESSSPFSDQAVAQDPEKIPTRGTGKVSPKPAHNPMQFVKIGSSSLYKKAEDQLKMTKKTDVIKEDEEEWLCNLDNWKSRRRKLSESAFKRQEEMKQIEQDEQMKVSTQKKTKTFSEMMEERAHRTRAASLCLYMNQPDPDVWGFLKDGKIDPTTTSSVVDKAEKTSTEDLASDINSPSVETVSTSNLGMIQKSRKIGRSAQQNLSSFHGENPAGASNDCQNILSSQSEKEKSNETVNGVNTEPSLDSINSIHNPSEMGDSNLKFCQESGSILEPDMPDLVGMVTTSTQLLEEFSGWKSGDLHDKCLNMKSDGVELSLKIPITLECGQNCDFTSKNIRDENKVFIDTLSPGGKEQQNSGSHGMFKKGKNAELCSVSENLLVKKTLHPYQNCSVDDKIKHVEQNGVKKNITVPCQDASLIKTPSKSKFRNEGYKKQDSIRDSNKHDVLLGSSKLYCSDSQKDSVEELKSCSKCEMPSSANSDISKRHTCSVKEGGIYKEGKNCNLMKSSEFTSGKKKKVAVHSSTASDDSSESKRVGIWNSCQNFPNQEEKPTVVYYESWDENSQHLSPHELSNIETVTTVHHTLNNFVTTHRTDIDDCFAKSQKKSEKENEGQKDVNENHVSLIEKVTEEMEKMILDQLEREEQSREFSHEPSPAKALCCDTSIGPKRNEEIVNTFMLQMDPPKEKPPPPPPVENVLFKENQESLIRVNSTKRIRNELWKRRSDFLGIESSKKVEISLENSLPSAFENIVKVDRNLKVGTAHRLEKNFISEEEDLAKRERKIIEDLEREENKRKGSHTVKEQELPVTEVVLPSNSKDDKQYFHGDIQEQRIEENCWQREENHYLVEGGKQFHEKQKYITEQEECLRVEDENPVLEQDIQQQERSKQQWLIQSQQVNKTGSTWPNTKNNIENAHSIQPLPKNNYLKFSPPKILYNSQSRQNNKIIASKRQSDMYSESKYNQNHWLIQEAEIRRIVEQKERQRLKNSHTSVACPFNSKVIQRPHEQPPLLPRKSLSYTSLSHEYPVGHQWNYGCRDVLRRDSTISGVKQHLFHYPVDYKHNHISAQTSESSRIVPVEHQEQMLSVSGRKRCSHCGEELGRGAAMIIESLKLVYHIQCFQCCVCQAQLGNGSCGTDVRVRNNKLHCQNCYSNDEAGLKFSQV